MAPALNYGVQAYEGLKAFRGPGDKTIQIFRPDRNATRLQHSASFICIPPVPVQLFMDAVTAAVARNAEYVPPHETGAAMYIRPQIYGSSAQLGLNPCEEYTFAVYVVPTGVYHGTAPTKAFILDEFDRAAPNGTGSAKVGGNYAPVLKWGEKARSEGYGINLHLDSATHSEIDEFSTSGFIGAIDDGQGNITIVVPDSKNVIDSVTSESIQEIGASFGWKVEKRSVGTSRQAPPLLVFNFLTSELLLPSKDQIHGAAHVQRGDGSRDSCFARAHPLYYSKDQLLRPQVPGRDRQTTPASRSNGRSGNSHLCPFLSTGSRPDLHQAAFTIQKYPAWQSQGRIWLEPYGDRGRHEKGSMSD